MEPTTTKLKSGAVVLLVLLLLPLCFIKLNNFHDWGDDFAQYLIQSEYFSGHINEIPVSDVSGYSPTGKGVLFSLILIPVTLFGDYTILAGKIIVSLALIGCCLIFFWFLNKRLNWLVSLIITLSFAYNYHILRLKDQILPDFLFTGILIAVLGLLSSGKQKHLLLAIFLANCTLLLKSSGIVLVIAMIIYFATHHFGFEADRKFRVKLIVLLVFSTILAFTLEYLLISGTPGPAWYAYTSITKISVSTVAQNFDAYKSAIIIYLEQELPMYMNTALKYIAITGMMGGFILAVFRKRSVIEIFILLYLLLLMFYPYPHDPVRFIIPVLPFLLLYLFECYFFVFKFLTPTHSAKLLLILAFAFAGSHIITTKKEIASTYTYDPYSNESQQLIAFIKQNIPETDTLSCTRPWAVAWFTDRRTVHASSKHKATWNIAEKGNETSSEHIEVFRNNAYMIGHSE